MSWLQPVSAPSATWSQSFSIFFVSYILGCFTAGYYLVRLRTGQDIRQIGSGSVGARNVSRAIGPVGFLLTLILDVAKGAVAVSSVNHFIADSWLAALAMIAVVTGHIWPIQLRCHGGKGVATSLGALLVYDPQLLFALGVIFACGFVLLRQTTLSGLLAFALVPLASMLMHQESAKVVSIAIVAGLVLIAHRKNLEEEIAHLIARRTVEPKPHQPFKQL